MSQASSFMKPTISTSPLAWSCTTAGIKPSSLEKSIGVAFRSSRVPMFRTTKNPAWSGGAAWVASSGRDAWLSPRSRAVPPAGHGGRDDGDARDGEPQPFRSAYMKQDGRCNLRADIRLGLDLDEHLGVN